MGKGKIYKIVNDINDKIYIGQTITTLEERFYKHVWESNNNRTTTFPLHNAIAKYGEEHFFIQPIEECDCKLLNEREKYWIQYYNTFNNQYGYNATIGGEGNSKYDEELILNLWSQGKNQVEIANTINCERHTVQRYLKSCGISIEDRANKKLGNAKKAILQLDPVTDLVIKEFSSATIAAKETNSTLSGISQVCNGKRKTHNGYKWKYKI